MVDWYYSGKVLLILKLLIPIGIILITIINGNTEDAWRFTGFYGEPETHRRSEAWNKLRSLNARMNIPWICGSRAKVHMGKTLC